MPFNRRLEFIYVPNTFCYDEASKTLYLNGTVQFAGTLYIDYIKDSADITNTDGSSWAFPSWSHALLGFYAINTLAGYVGITEAKLPNKWHGITTNVVPLAWYDKERTCCAFPLDIKAPLPRLLP